MRSFKVTVQGSRPALTLSQDDIDSLERINIFTQLFSTTLTVVAAVANNLTKIQCSDGGSPAQFSEEIEITVIGNAWGVD